MKRAMRGIYYAAIIASGWLSAAYAQPLLEPPLDLRWGDSPEKLISWASRHSLDVNIFIPGNQARIRKIKIFSKKDFLPETQASSAEGHFLDGRLIEVTLHHQDPEATAEMIEARFEALRKQLTIDHGPLLKNQQKRSVDDQFVTRTQTYLREPVQGLFLLLAMTEVEDLLRKSKLATYSVIYRNDNYRKELEAKAAPP